MLCLSSVRKAKEVIEHLYTRVSEKLLRVDTYLKITYSNLANVCDELSCHRICNVQDHSKYRLLLLRNQIMWFNAMRSRWNKALPLKHNANVVTATCAFVVNEVPKYIFVQYNNETLVIYSTIKGEMKSNLGKFHPKIYVPHTPIMVHSRIKKKLHKYHILWVFHSV